MDDFWSDKTEAIERRQLPKFEHPSEEERERRRTKRDAKRPPKKPYKQPHVSFPMFLYGLFCFTFYGYSNPPWECIKNKK